MARYDIEDILDNVESILKSNLNAKIAEIEAHKDSKGKGIGLDPVDNEAYIRQILDSKINNYSPAIFFGLDSMQSTGNGYATDKRIEIFVDVIISTYNADGRDSDRLLRYSRALEETLQAAFKDSQLLASFVVNQVSPENVRLSYDSADEVRVGGIKIKGSLA